MSEHVYLDHHTDPLDVARWIAEEGGEPVESTIYSLLDIAESLRRIANHLDRKDTTA